MSRSGYTDDEDVPGQFAMWRGTVASAIRGKRGQKMLRDLLAALDAMPQKRLITSHLVDNEGEVCALGALGKHRGVDLSHCEQLIDADGYCEDSEALASRLSKAFDIATPLAQEIQYLNDERCDFKYVGNERRAYTPEERWEEMRKWVASKIKNPAETKP